MFQTTKNQMAKKIDCSMAMAKHFDLPCKQHIMNTAIKGKKRKPSQKGKLTSRILLAEDGKRGIGTSPGKDTPI